MSNERYCITNQDGYEDKPLLEFITEPADEESIKERKSEQKSILICHNSNLKRKFSNNNSHTRRIMNFNRRNTRNNIKGFNRLIKE